MEEILTETESGVESAQVADVQTQESEVTSETANVTDVANQNNEGKDFSTALKARETQIRQQMEQEYSTKLTESQSKLSYLERQAKISGYDSVETYMKALDDYEHQQEIAKEAEKYGVPEDFIRGELKPLKDKIQQYEQQIQDNQKSENDRQFKAEYDRVKTANPDFEQYIPKIEELYKKGYNVDLETAYKIASMDDKLAKIGQEKEQEVLANVTNRNNKQVLSSKEKPNNLAHTPSNMSFADIEAMSKRVQAGEKITFN